MNNQLVPINHHETFYIDLNESCRVCRLKRSMVLYFDIPVCSGCRAFFIRSMNRKKTYFCLNNRLCGQENELVPTRRVCKKCRFERCIQAGMLEAKIQLQNHLENLKNAKQQTTLLFTQPLSVTQIEDNKDVLSLYSRFRQRYRYELSQLCGPTESHECTNGVKKAQFISKNFVILSQAIKSMSDEQLNLFGRFDSSDLHTLSIFEYNVWIQTAESTLLTIQNFGHKTKRLYALDQSYSHLNLDYFHNKWSYLLPVIRNTVGDDAQQAFDIMMDYMFQYNVTLGSKIALLMEKIQLDETEFSAFMLLLMTREAYIQIVKSQESREHLKWLRNQTFKSLAKHIQSTGRDVNERIPEIVQLFEEFLEVGRLARKFARLLTLATNIQISYDRTKTNIDLFIKTNEEYVHF